MPKTTIKTPAQEWSMLCNIGWSEQDVPELRNALLTLKDAQNIAELKKFLKRYPESSKKVAKKTTKKSAPQTASFQIIVSQQGLIKTVDSGSTVDYQVGRFSYLCDGEVVIVTKKSGHGMVNIAHYTYKSEEEAQEMGWRMAKKQESDEKCFLDQQKA